MTNIFIRPASSDTYQLYSHVASYYPENDSKKILKLKEAYIDPTRVRRTTPKLTGVQSILSRLGIPRNLQYNNNNGNEDDDDDDDDDDDIDEDGDENDIDVSPNSRENFEENMKSSIEKAISVAVSEHSST